MKRVILIKYYVVAKFISKPIVNHGGIINVSKQFILLTINVNIFTLILKAQGSI